MPSLVCGASSSFPEVEMAARLTTFVVVAIVAATLIAGLIVGAQRDDSDGPVDLIVHHARVYTATAEGTMAEAVAIRGNQILRVGSDREIARLKRPQTTMLDAKGAAVLPGFNDAHLDLVQGGAALDRIDLLDTASVEDAELKVRDWAEANPDRPWILGRGWTRRTFGGSLPNRQMLDDIVPDRPAQLLSADGRYAWVNTRALELARIKRRTANPAHGLILREARSGEATGVLEGAAIGLVDAVVPKPTTSEQERALRAAISELHRFGVTSVQDVGGSLTELSAYADARRAGDLRLRIYSAVPITGDLPDGELDRLESETRKYADDPLFKAGAMSVDLGDSSEAPSGDTAKAAKTGMGIDPDTLNRLVRRLDARGWQILTEAPGAAAVGRALDAYAHAVRSNPTRATERRHRIEGMQAVADEDLGRFDALRVLTSLRPFEDAGLQAAPAIAASAAETGVPGALARHVSFARGRLAFGSGWPAAPINPLLGIGEIVKPAGDPGDEDAARLSLKAAIDAYTSSGAWASFDEQRKGTIAPGMLADLVILSGDIFKSAAADVAATRVEATIFDGKVVYRRGQRDSN
jgi:predicted amidohydrolase YtcJ